MEIAICFPRSAEGPRRLTLRNGPILPFGHWLDHPGSGLPYLACAKSTSSNENVPPISPPVRTCAKDSAPNHACR
jgi:hypothetical protein